MPTMIEASLSTPSFRPYGLVGALVAGLALAAGAAQAQISTPGPDVEPGGICQTFPELGNTAGFAACPTRPNIVISTDDAQPIDGPYLLLQDRSGGSQACNTTPEFTGNWLEKVGGCGQLCFDFRVFHAGYPPDPVYPRIAFTDANGVRASFKAFNAVTPEDGWVHICAPIRAVEPGETTLPANATGEWRIEDAPGSGNFSNAGSAHIGAWNSAITNVGVFRLPIDYTSQPSEEAGYDNFCFTAGGCGKSEPEPQACLEAQAEIACLQGSPVVAVTTAAPGGMSPALIELFSLTEGVSVSPSGTQPIVSPLVATLQGAQPGQTVTLMANAIALGGGSVEGTDQCCAAQFEVTIPESCPVTDDGGSDDGSGSGHDGNGGDGHDGNGGDGPADDGAGITDLELRKSVTSGPSFLQLGDGVTGVGFEWMIEVVNSGTTSIPNGAALIVRDQIPAGMTVVGTALTDPGFQCGTVPFTGPGLFSCAWQGGTVAPGAPVGRIFLQTVTDQATAGRDPEQNCASVALQGPDDALLDEAPDNNDACAEAPVSGSSQKASLSIDKHGHSRCTAGKACNYEVIIGAEAQAQGMVVVVDEIRPGKAGRLVGPSRGWRCEGAGRSRLVCARRVDIGSQSALTLPVTLRANRSPSRETRLRQCASIGNYESLPRRLAMRLVQERLRALGHYDGAVDGLLGPRTRRALDAFASTTTSFDRTNFDQEITPAVLEAVLGPALRGPAEPACVSTRIRPAQSHPRPANATPSGQARPSTGGVTSHSSPVSCPPLTIPRKDGKGCRPKVNLELNIPLGEKH